MVRLIPVRHFPALHFQRPLEMSIPYQQNHDYQLQILHQLYGGAKLGVKLHVFYVTRWMHQLFSSLSALVSFLFHLLCSCVFIIVRSRFCRWHFSRKCKIIFRNSFGNLRARKGCPCSAFTMLCIGHWFSTGAPRNAKVQRAPALDLDQ